MTITSALPQASDTDRADLFYAGVGDRSMAGGRGVYAFDDQGRRYIDCAAGTFNLSLGYGHPEIVEVVRAQAGKLIHASSSFRTEPVMELVERLVGVAPANLNRVHLKVASGSEANEGAIKIAQHATGGRDVVTLFRSHLGQTLAMGSYSGAAFRREPFPNVHPNALCVPDPYCHRCFYRQRPETCGLLCADRIEDFIEYASSGRVACVMVEPISGNGGNIVAPPGYLRRLREICDERDIVLVFDEIQTGFGRTGRMFAADHFGVSPHIMTVAKGLGGSGLQVAAILTEERLVGLDGMHHSFTYGSNVLAAAAACKTIEILERPGFLDNVRRVGDFVQDRLREMRERLPRIGDIRGVGLMIGFEVVDADGRPDVDTTKRLIGGAMDHGLLLRSSLYGRGNVIKFRPPLVMTVDEAAEACERIERLFWSTL